MDETHSSVIAATGRPWPQADPRLGCASSQERVSSLANAETNQYYGPSLPYGGGEAADGSSPHDQNAYAQYYAQYYAAYGYSFPATGDISNDGGYSATGPGNDKAGSRSYSSHKGGAEYSYADAICGEGDVESEASLAACTYPSMHGHHAEESEDISDYYRSVNREEVSSYDKHAVASADFAAAAVSARSSLAARGALAHSRTQEFSAKTEVTAVAPLQPVNMDEIYAACYASAYTAHGTYADVCGAAQSLEPTAADEEYTQTFVGRSDRSGIGNAGTYVMTSTILGRSLDPWSLKGPDSPGDSGPLTGRFDADNGTEEAVREKGGARAKGNIKEVVEIEAKPLVDETKEKGEESNRGKRLADNKQSKGSEEEVHMKEGEEEERKGDRGKVLATCMAQTSSR